MTMPSDRLKPKRIVGSGMLGADPQADTGGDAETAQAPAGRLQAAPALAALSEPAPGLPAPAAEPEDVQQPAAPAAEPLPAAGDSRRRQVTVLVGVDVRDRFDAFRHQHKLRNTAVIIDALNAARGRYRELVQARQPRQDPEALFGDAVPGRRLSTEIRKTTQLAFYFTYREFGNLQMVASQADTNYSALLDAVLDDFLPPLPARRRTGREVPAGS
jgi:hypothetical protein